MDQHTDDIAGLIGGTIRDELASQRTELSFEQAEMSSELALFASVCASMALITFGFIIFEYLQRISDEYLSGGLPAHSPRRFGLALLVLGVVLLCVEIFNHGRYAKARRARRQGLFDQGLVRHPEAARPSSAKIVAVLLLIVGILLMLRVILSAGPL